MWQPIETAPKDGTEILIGGRNYLLKWFSACAVWRDGWMVFNGDTDDWTDECHQADYWMAIPAPPDQSCHGSEET